MKYTRLQMLSQSERERIELAEESIARVMAHLPGLLEAVVKVQENCGGSPSQVLQAFEQLESTASRLKDATSKRLKELRSLCSYSF